MLESLNEPIPSPLADKIPQLDGPIDDENARTSGSSDDADVTIESQEHVICEYKKVRGRGSVTPGKRKRATSVVSEDDDSNGGAKRRKKIKDPLPKTPRRSPSKRMSKLTSPSCPNRTYSPLSVEITVGQRTPKNSPRTSPTKSPRGRRRLGSSFGRKRIFSPLKESRLGSVIVQSFIRTVYL